MLCWLVFLLHLYLSLTLAFPVLTLSLFSNCVSDPAMAALPMAQSGRHSYLRTFSKVLLISLLFAAIIPLSVRSSSLKSPALRPQPDVVLSKTTVEKSEISRDIIDSANITRLQKRDQYACKKGTPCKQDACCGSFDADGNGECGLGPTWCGADCDSKCDARAEW